MSLISTSYFQNSEIEREEARINAPKPPSRVHEKWSPHAGLARHPIQGLWALVVTEAHLPLLYLLGGQQIHGGLTGPV